MTKGRKSTPEELAVCKEWHSILYTSGFKVDESEELREETEETPKAVKEEATKAAAQPQQQSRQADVGTLSDADIPF